MTTRTRRRILTASAGHQCPYCGVTMTMDLVVSGPHSSHATIEHLRPTSRGGCVDDWIIACHGCNTDKGSLLLDEWRAALSVRYRTVCVFWFERRIPTLLLNIVLLNMWQTCASIL